MVKMAQPPVQNQLQITIANGSKRKVNFRHSYRPVYIVSRIFGQMPFTISYNGNGEILRAVVNKRDGVWFACSLSVFIYMILSTIEYFDIEKSSISGTNISFVGTFFIFGIGLFIGTLTIILDMCYRSKFVDIFKEMIIFDGKVDLNKTDLKFLFVFHSAKMIEFFSK